MFSFCFGLFFSIYEFFKCLVFTEDEMNALMDRSDLTYTEKKPEIKEEMMKMEGVFKRVDQPSE